MDDILEKLMEAILKGGPTGLIAILIAIIGFLVWDRKRLSTALEKQDERILKIVDEYHKGNMNLVEAINSLKLVLIEIRAKL